LPRFDLRLAAPVGLGGVVAANRDPNWPAGGDPRLCKTGQRGGQCMSRLLASRVIAKERSLMAIRRDFTTERITRVEAQLAVARMQVSMLVPTDRRRAAQLCDQLDDMLEELLGRTEADRQRNA
jgi:hypothetical protein